jgi:hypothetical protein
MEETIEKHKPIIVLEMHGPDSIKEAWTELRRHNYVLTNLSNSRSVASIEDIVYGHYLAVYGNFSDQKQS